MPINNTGPKRPKFKKPKSKGKGKGKGKKAKKAQENDLPENFSDKSSKVESPIHPATQRVRRVQSLRDQNVNFLAGETSHSVRRIYTAEYTD